MHWKKHVNQIISKYIGIFCKYSDAYSAEVSLQLLSQAGIFLNTELQSHGKSVLKKTRMLLPHLMWWHIIHKRHVNTASGDGLTQRIPHSKASWIDVD